MDGGCTLPNLEWWDSVAYDQLSSWVPTLGKVPKDIHHGLALFRGAVCREIREARSRGDAVGEARAWKLLTFGDRFLLCAPPSTRGGAQHSGIAGVVTARLRLAWHGDWGSLCREAGVAASHAPRSKGRTPTAEEDVRAVRACLKDGLLGRALGRLLRAGGQAVGAGVCDTLRSLFQQGAFPSPLPVAPPLSADARQALVAEARRCLRHYPPRSGPGPNGSRFEHWGTVCADSESWDAASEVIVMFLLGECPAEALAANLGSRLVALRKPNGSVRPLACGSVLRRLAARAACVAFRAKLRAGCGPLQFGVGRPAGCEQVHKALSALASAAPRDVALAFDAKNAYNSMSRGAIFSAVAARVPELLGPACQWLGRPTTHLFWGDGLVAQDVHATRGVDQGCPLSPALFALGLAGSLDAIDARLRQLAPTARTFAYLDDVVIFVPAAHAVAAVEVVREQLGVVGLELNVDKTAAWTLDPDAPLPDAIAPYRQPALRCLGAATPWVDPDDPLGKLTVLGRANGDAAVAAAADLVSQLRRLRDAGLEAREAFLLLQSYSHSSITHLLRANFEDGAWPEQWDSVFVDAVGELVGASLDATRRALVFLRLADGGLGFASARATAAPAYLGSWALTLSHVAGFLPVDSWQGFCARCPGVAATLDAAEARLRADGGASLRGPDWVACLARARPKQQAAWSQFLRAKARQDLLSRLGEDDRVDLRSFGGPGAGGFLQPPVVCEDEKSASIPDSHFRLALRDRLLLPICPPGACCQHRSKEGVVCGAALDPRGKHALKCEVGPCRNVRHNGLRDFCARFHQRVTGFVALTEQRVSAWDRINPRTGRLEEATLDVATRDAVHGRSIYVDTTVTCAHSGYEPCQRARANKDGLAASNAVDDKRARYPPSGGELVPVAFEAGGRPADTTVAFVRSWGARLEAAERSEVIRFAWQQLSLLVQTGNADLVLSAVG